MVVTKSYPQLLETANYVQVFMGGGGREGGGGGENAFSWCMEQRCDLASLVQCVIILNGYSTTLCLPSV